MKRFFCFSIAMLIFLFSFINAYSIVDDKVEPKKLIYGVVTKDEVKKF